MTVGIRAAYLFPGQGAQYVGMGKDLYEGYAEARQVFDRANELFGTDLRKICFDGPEEDLKKTRFAQPAIYVTSIACLRVFEAKLGRTGEVAAMAGLSLGEATALTAAGVLSFDEGVRFVKDRGLFMEEASQECPGTMTAVLGLKLDKIEEICRKTGAQVGNLNCPGQVVVSGRTAAVQEASKLLEEAGARRCIPLDVSGAFHSSCMDSASKKIELALQSINMRFPRVPVISNLTATETKEPGEIKRILVQQMNHRTLWEDSMRRLMSMGIRRCYELGPGKVLKGLFKKIDPSMEVVTMGTAAEIEMAGSRQP